MFHEPEDVTLPHLISSTGERSVIRLKERKYGNNTTAVYFYHIANPTTTLDVVIILILHMIKLRIRRAKDLPHICISSKKEMWEF